MRRSLLLVALLFAMPPARASAPRAGLWEEQDSVDGTAMGAPVRACRIAGAYLAQLQAWPASCVAEPPHRTAAGITLEARCATGRADLSLLLRRVLTGDPDRRYNIVASSQIVGSTTSAPRRSTATFRYIGPCPGADVTGAAPAAAVAPVSSHEPLPVSLIRIVAPAILVLGSIAVMGWFLRRCWHYRLDQATAANIVPDAAGAATVPVLVTFTGIRGLPWWYAIAMNNAKPLLVIEPDGIAFRVVRRQRRSFFEIACLDVRRGKGTVNLDFAFRGSLFTFAANVGTIEVASHVIAMMPASLPFSPRALALRTSA